MKKLIALLLVLTMVFAFAGCEPTPEEDTENTVEPAQVQVSLSEAMSNTMEALKAGNLTITIVGGMESKQEQMPGLVSGNYDPIEGQLKVLLDPEEKELTVYGTTTSANELTTVIIHDGWMVNSVGYMSGYYDSYLSEYLGDYLGDDVGSYFKVDISDSLDILFDDSEFESLEDVLDKIPEETLAEIEEVVDLEKLLELLETLGEEKFTNEQWWKDNFEYTATTEDGVTVHTFEIDPIMLLDLFFGHFEEVFVNAEDFEDLMEQIEDLTDYMPEFSMQVKLIQTGDMITGYGIYAETNESETKEQIKLDFTVTISDIGTTEIDTEMLDNIIEELPESEEFYEEYYGDYDDIYDDIYDDYYDSDDVTDGESDDITEDVTET